jgi:ribosome-binding protein aMBF1 (putative translation factor)
MKVLEMLYKKIGKMIQVAREEAGLSQEELA